MNKIYILKCCFLFFALAGIFGSYHYRQKPAGDYANYYYGSKFIFAGVSIQDIYDPATFNHLIAQEGTKEVFVNYAPVPPFSLIFFAPFTFQNIVLSKFLFNSIGILLFSFSIYRLFKSLNIDPLYSLLVFGLLLIPMRNNIVLGQTYFLIGCFLIEGYLFSENKKDIPAAFFFALPIALKIFPAILLFWLFFTGKRKQFLLTILFALLLFLISIPFTGTAFFIQYMTDSLPRLFNGEINDPYAVSYQSFTVLIRKLLVHDSILNPQSLFDLPWLFLALNTLFSAFIISVLIRVLNTAKENNFFCFGFTFFAGMLLTGYGTNYGLLLLVFIVLASLSKGEKPAHQIVFIMLVLLITSFPVHLTAEKFPLALQFVRWYAMFGLFLFLIKKDLFRSYAKIYFITVSLLLIPVFVRLLQKQDESRYYLPKEPSLLLTGFNPGASGLWIRYISIQGEDSVFHKTNDRFTGSDALSVRKNQLYYRNIPVATGSDHKKDPVLLNDKEILYLSDKGRGIGLYGLRKIRIKE